MGIGGHVGEQLAGGIRGSEGKFDEVIGGGHALEFESDLAEWHGNFGTAAGDAADAKRAIGLQADAKAGAADGRLAEIAGGGVEAGLDAGEGLE